jgi:hypothetical protein
MNDPHKIKFVRRVKQKKSKKKLNQKEPAIIYIFSYIVEWNRLGQQTANYLAAIVYKYR